MPLIHIEDLHHQRHMKDPGYRSGYEFAESHLKWWDRLERSELELLIKVYKSTYEMDKDRNINALGIARYLEQLAERKNIAS
jgi:hypothetical protein